MTAKDNNMKKPSKVLLVLSDVDGTILAEAKVLGARSQKAVAALHDAGIKFAITSGRPPRGMSMLFDPLGLATPIAGFNGGQFVKRDFEILQQEKLSGDIARQAIGLIQKYRLDLWLFSGADWLVTSMVAPHVEKEVRAVKFSPRVVSDFNDYLDDAAKIVAVSDDYDRLQQCEAEALVLFGKDVSATCSRSCYLDITNKNANKGAVVNYLSQHLSVPAEEIIAIGDGHNDVLMFKRSGFSIAMGNATDEVKSYAATVTASYNDEGFAKAMEVIIDGSIFQEEWLNQ